MAADQGSLHIQINRVLGDIRVSLLMLSNLDQRVGVKSLYLNSSFNTAVANYHAASHLAFADSTDFDAIVTLNATANDFLRFCQGLYPPGDRKRMRTVLRRDFGKTFSYLYKNTVTLLHLTETLSRTDQAIAPINVPDQQAAPIYTKVENGRVILQQGRSLHPFLKADAVTETRRYLSNELSEIHKVLSSSNIEKKYIDTFGRLIGLVNFSDDAGAISFGLHVRMVALLTKKIEDELSDLLHVQINATLTHAAFFASQYKDWMDFLQNALAYRSRDEIEGKMTPALESIATLLEENPESIDERIPHTIKFITTLLSGSAEDRKQAAFASIRSIENFCITSIRYCYDVAKDYLQDSGAAARPRLVKIGAFAIVTVALGVIGHFMPVIVNTAELAWIVENLPNIEKLSRILKP